jgi:uncharacterized protein (TIGR03435 family)
MVSALFVITCLTISHAQSPRPAFDVASISVSRSQKLGDIGHLYTLPGGRFTANAVTLRVLIFNAYRLNSYYQLIGDPDWVNAVRWDIEAKALGNPTPQQVDLMLQSLIEDRFHLKLHWDKQQLAVSKDPVEVLVIDSVQKPSTN